ncbi:MAG: hypothetical protein U0414_23895 [Polyangiaceae bacterium]
MSRGLGLGLAGVLLAACGATPVAVAPEKTMTKGGVPDWLPPYSNAQQALLAPTKMQVTLPAVRTFPDLEHFAYSDDLVLQDPVDAVRLSQLIARTVERSPRTYGVVNAGPEVANLVAQYGPLVTTEPDAFIIPKTDTSGHTSMETQPYSSDAKDAFEAGLAEEKAGAFDRAEQHFKEAIAESPSVPALHLAYARMLAKRSSSEAEAELRRTIRLDPTLAIGHRELGRILFDRGDLPGARNEIAHALAYDPPSKAAMDLATKLKPADNDPKPQWWVRVQPYAIFVDVDPAGMIRIASPNLPSARMYAGCRAVMRYEVDLRAHLFELPPEEPYFLSAAEEMLCVESAIGAMIVDRRAAISQGEEPPKDPQAENLLMIAHMDGLLGYVMFEVLGQWRPERARMAPASVHHATFLYVARNVLNWDPERADREPIADAPTLDALLAGVDAPPPDAPRACATLAVHVVP